MIHSIVHLINTSRDSQPKHNTKFPLSIRNSRRLLKYWSGFSTGSILQDSSPLFESTEEDGGGESGDWYFT